MPLCPQITMTPVPVTSSGITMGWVKPAVFPSTMTASSLLTTLYSSTAPIAYTIGQLWADAANGNKLYRCFTVATVINAVGNGTTVTYTTDADHGLTTGDLVTIGEIDPTAYNLTAKTVASAPTTTTFTITSTATGTYVDGGWVAGWKTVQDSAIATAQTKADDAWSAVLGKNTIFYAGTAPGGTGYTVGDTWFNTASGNAISKWSGTAWVAVTFGSAAFAGGSVDTAALASGAVDASKILSGAVTTAKIAAGAVGATEIAANAIVAGKIAAASITSTEIAAGTITASNIASGAITASMITAGTMSADRISGGTISGSIINTSLGITTSGIITGGTIASTGGMSCSTISASSAVNCASGTGSFLSVAVTNGVIAATLAGPSATAIDVTTSLKNSGAPSVTGTNNVILSATNVFQKNTASSERFKRDIVFIAEIPELDPRLLLNIPIRAFKYRDDYISASDSRFDTFVPGMIAEEVDAIYPIAVEYDGDTHDGPPLVWNEKYLIPGMLALIQQQATTIASLEARITALEGN